MKNNKVKIIFLIIAGILLLVGIIEIIHFTKKNETPHRPGTDNGYTVSSKVEELPGTKVYNSPTLNSEHCLDTICVENVSFYYTDEGGRMEYTVINKSDKVASGFLKLVFGKQSLKIVYQDVPAGGKVKSGTFYANKTIESMEDYHLEYLSDEDYKKIIYSK